MGKKVIMAVTNDLLTDQRVDRSCCALSEAGYSVLLVGRWLKDSGPLLPRRYATLRMRLLFHKKVFFYAEYNLRLFLKLLFSDADLFYANDTDTLPACYLAARLRRKALFFDAHEMFPEVPELSARPRVKRFWEHIESHIFPRIGSKVHGSSCTVCQSIADEYRRRYGISMAVVRNVPSATASPAELSMPEIRQPYILYQGAVNVGRGIEWMIDAMEFVDGFQFVVAGIGDLYDQLQGYASSKQWHKKVLFVGRLAPGQLRSLTLSAALGVVLMEKRGLNYYYSLPNRIGDFALAHVPVVASNFPEISRVVGRYQIGTLVDCDETPDAKSLAGIVNSTLAVWQSMPEDEKSRRFEAAATDLSWERHDKIVLQKCIDAIFL